MIALLLKKTESLKTSRKKQLKFLITQSTIIIHNVKRELQQKKFESYKSHPSAVAIEQNLLPDFCSTILK